jgi:hypothetical protein
MSIESLARRVLAEFEEMPGLALTRDQASRLFGISQDACHVVLDVLVDSAYLRETNGGTLMLGPRVAS